jgi:hypothetical protein
LRNPSDRQQDFTTTLAAVLELPADSTPSYAARSPWKAESAASTLNISVKEQHTFHLQPFQVLTLVLVPSS